MLAVVGSWRKVVKTGIALVGLAALAACDPNAFQLPEGPAAGPVTDTSKPVKIALLVPSGTETPELDTIAANLENAARLAAADLGDVQTDITVYSTQRNTQVAIQAAQQAMADGADIILGPLDGDAAAAVGITVAPAGLNVLTFSNNPAIAGGNVFLLGQTFEDSAQTVARFAKAQGKQNVVILHGEDVAGQAGRDAALKAVSAAGSTTAAVIPYPLSLEGASAAASAANSTVGATDADAVFLTSTSAGALPILAELLPERGLTPDRVQYLGLSRWDADTRLFSLPAIQGGWFAMPDRGRESAFKARYAAAHGSNPHILASTAYDGMAVIGALWASDNDMPLSTESLTTAVGFQGAQGILRFKADGSNERGLAVGTVQGNDVLTLRAAPTSFASAAGL